MPGLQEECHLHRDRGGQPASAVQHGVADPSPDVTVGSTSGGADDDADKDESWTQFISGDAWCSSMADGAEESTTCVALAS